MTIMISTVLFLSYTATQLVTHKYDSDEMEKDER